MTDIICCVEECIHNEQGCCNCREIIVNVFDDNKVPRCTTFEYEED